MICLRTRQQGHHHPYLDEPKHLGSWEKCKLRPADILGEKDQQSSKTDMAELASWTTRTTLMLILETSTRVQKLLKLLGTVKVLK